MIYILKFDWHIPYEGGGTEVRPLKYGGGIENLKKQLEKACKRSRKRGEFTFENVKFYEIVNYQSVKVITLDEWLSSYGIKN